jgi:hypothetical protein
MPSPTPPNLGGRPRSADPMVPVPLRLPASLKARLPRNADGKPDQEWLRAAVADCVDALEEELARIEDEKSGVKP